MTLIKTQKEIEIMQRAGKVLGEVLQETLERVKPGITELELDLYAEKRIVELGGFPGFKKVEGYHHAICVATNDVVVHGIPKKRVLKEGDIIGIDCGVFLDGFHTDMAETVVVGKTENKEIYKFLESGKEAMYAGIRQAKAGNHVGDISKAIQEIVEKRDRYSVTRSLIGHGVGRELHEDPQVPGYLSGKIERTPLLVPGMTIAVEVIYNMGTKDVVYEGSDDWTIVTEDGSLSSVFERTIEITAEEPRLITPFPGETL
ncbi:MAG: type I methionyl aminopeptidase [Candidatus Levyibacteriota bacterium]